MADSAASSIITDARSYARGSVNSAQSLLDKIRQLSDRQFPRYNYPIADSSKAIDVNAIFNSLGALPTQPSLSITAPTLPGAFTSPAITSVAPVALPQFSGTAPVLNFPQAPSSNLSVSAPGSAPTFNAPSMPNRPVLVMPTLPSLADVKLPSVPTIVLPVFDRAAPAYDIAAPSARFDFAEAPYNSLLLDKLKVKLLNDLENGGYGIETDDEQKLWERGREREQLTADASVKEAERDFASRGFMMPPGALFGAIAQARARADEAINSLSREVMLKRSELYVQNRQFTIGQVKELESTLINMHMATMERFLNVAKYTAQFALDLYESRLKEAQIKLDGWKTEAQVYGERVRAEISRLEAYRVEMQGAQLATDVQKSRVELYRAALAGVESMVSIYKSQVDAAQVVGNVERLKLEAYKTTIDGYTAAVQAKTAEFAGYESRIKGETAKADAYMAQVRAFSAQMEGARVASDIQTSNARLQIEQSNAASRNNELNVQAAKVASDIAIETARVNLQAYGFQIDGYKTRSATASDVSRALIAKSGQEIEKSKAMSDTYIKYISLDLEALKAQTNLQLTAGVEGAKIYQSLISSALGSITSIASISE